METLSLWLWFFFVPLCETSSLENKSARHGRHAGRITGGTECYGRRYACDNPSNLIDSDVPNSLRGCSLPFVPQSHSRTTNYPADLFVEIQRVKVLLRCRFLWYPRLSFVTAPENRARATDRPTFIIV